MDKNLEIGQEVVIVSGETAMLGMRGKIIDFRMIIGGLYCVVDFGKDVSEFSRSGEKTTCLFIHSVRVQPHADFQDDFDTLINLALDTNDELWFNELLARKQMQEVF